MKFYPAAYYFHRRIAERRSFLKALYVCQFSEEEKAHRQLLRFNLSWQESLRLSPWAVALKEHFNLPSEFPDWRTFDEAMPVVGKAELRAVIEKVSSSSGFDFMATGGTSSSPFRFPVLPGESAEARGNMSWYRERFGLDYRSSAFLLWGHSHLLGSGMSGVWNRAKRSVGDRLMGYHRFSAYELSDDALRTAGDSLNKDRPDYFIGYTRAIEQFVFANRDRRDQFSHLRLVQPTGEGYTSDESRGEVIDFFSGNVQMEYGSVETGPIAYEADSGFDSLWYSHRLELAADGTLAVTSLYPRALPLLRYQLGDCCEAVDPNDRIERVAGRVNDFVEVGGHRVHSELISHAVRDAKGVAGYQILVAQTGEMRLLLECRDDISDGDMQGIRNRLMRVQPDFKYMSVEAVKQLAVGPSGKRPMVIRE
ncbi:MAG: phenylacetate-CoA ligase [Candidatus Azotimanducaceae bacterium]|jgi:phenylacetate-CoA ligase